MHLPDGTGKWAHAHVELKAWATSRRAREEEAANRMPPVPPMVVDVTALTTAATAKRFLGSEMCVIILYEARKYIPAIQYYCVVRQIRCVVASSRQRDVLSISSTRRHDDDGAQMMAALLRAAGCCSCCCAAAAAAAAEQEVRANDFWRGNFQVLHPIQN